MRTYPRPVIARLLCGIALLLAAVSTSAAAEPPAPGGIPDLVGPRALALGAAIGIASGNEGLFLNPATVAARKRYSIEAGLLVDRRGAETVGRFYGGSVVDSITAPVTAGISYVRANRGEFTGSVWHAALAGPIAQGLYLGVCGKYLALHGPKNSDAATVDAGFFWQVADLVSIGAAGYNLVSIANDAVAPMGAGAGIGLGNDRAFQLTADWRADFDRAGKTTNRYAAGLEVLLGDLVPIRAGWSRDEVLDGHWWSIGAGLVTRSGIALDVGYRQSLDDPSARTVAATLRTFL
jgi:hypothetical protein